MRPFHLALPVSDLSQVKEFYGNILGCKFGRKDKNWIDIDFYGHQLVFHQDKSYKPNNIANHVDGKNIRVPHFGLVMELSDWHILANKLQNHKLEFIIDPYVRFKGEKGEQATMFFLDPNDYAIEIKAFKNDKMLFEK
jgi:uncharacterized protein